MIKRKLKLKWVSDVIGEEYNDWQPGDWVKVISAPGTGKTYFILNKLIKYLEYDERVLILCNRIALKRQMKIDLLKNMNEEIPKTKSGKIDYKAIDKMKDFDNIRIMSYQQLGSQYKKHEFKSKVHKYNLENYKYIVADECHFFYSDGKFNPNTEYALKQLLEEGRMAIKIFISATIGKLDKLLNDAVKKFGINFIFQKTKMWNYDTGTDYSYLNFKYFKKLESLAKVINNDNSDERWLIFVNSDYERRKLASMLKCDFDYINSERKNNKQFQNIINNCQFTCKVLISTTVIDNGVNIKDDKLINLVLMCKDWATFIQELGRIRYENIDNEIYSNEITLYLMVRSKKDFNRIKEQHKFVDEQIKLFNNDRENFNYKFSDFDKKTPCKDYLNMIFRNGKENGQWEISSLGLDIYNEEKSFIKNMIYEFNGNYSMKQLIEDLNGEWIGIPEYTFIEQELKWLFPKWKDKSTEDYKIVLSEMLKFEINTIDNDVELEEVEELRIYLDSMFKNKVIMLSKIDREPLVKRIGLYDTNHGKLFSGRETLNSYLKDNNIPYKIREFETSRIIDGKKKKFKCAWKLEKIEIKTY